MAVFFLFPVSWFVSQFLVTVHESSFQYILYSFPIACCRLALYPHFALHLPHALELPVIEESGANREEVEEARVAVDTVVHEVSRHYRGFLQQRRQKGVSGARRGSRRRMNRESGAGVSGNDRNGGQDASPAGGTSLDSAEEGGAGGFPDEEEAFLGTGQYDPESGDLEVSGYWAMIL